MNELNTQTIEEVVENTETQTVEENVDGIELTDTTEARAEETKEVKMLTQEEVEKMLERRLARQQEKLTKNFEKELSKYKNTETILKAGLGVNDLDEANEQLKSFYTEQGTKIPEAEKPGLTTKEIEILAKAEAEEFIEDGIEEMTREANRLAGKGYENLNAKEKVVFNTLASKLDFENKKTELIKNGIKAEVLESDEFKQFANKFNPRTGILEIYNLYNGNNKKEAKPIGSMATTETNKVKDFYTYAEMDKLTEKDLDNPQIMKAVERSLQKLYQDNH